MRIFFHILVYALVAGVFVTLIHGDLKALALPGSILIVVGVAALALRNSRWIDIASGPWHELAVGNSYIEAQAVEDMVAERMERLSRLRGNVK